MNITKAIKILEIEKRYFYLHANPDIKDALSLGIEALRRHLECKDRTRKGMLLRLPSETPEEGP